MRVSKCREVTCWFAVALRSEPQLRAQETLIMVHLLLELEDRGGCGASEQ